MKVIEDGNCSFDSIRLALELQENNVQLRSGFARMFITAEFHQKTEVSLKFLKNELNGACRSNLINRCTNTQAIIKLIESVNRLNICNYILSQTDIEKLGRQWNFIPLFVNQKFGLKVNGFGTSKLPLMNIHPDVLHQIDSCDDHIVLFYTWNSLHKQHFELVVKTSEGTYLKKHNKLRLPDNVQKFLRDARTHFGLEETKNFQPSDPLPFPTRTCIVNIGEVKSQQWEEKGKHVIGLLPKIPTRGRPKKKREFFYIDQSKTYRLSNILKLCIESDSRNAIEFDQEEENELEPKVVFENFCKNDDNFSILKRKGVVLEVYSLSKQLCLSLKGIYHTVNIDLEKKKRCYVRVAQLTGPGKMFCQILTFYNIEPCIGGDNGGDDYSDDNKGNDTDIESNETETNPPTSPPASPPASPQLRKKAGFLCLLFFFCCLLLYHT